MTDTPTGRGSSTAASGGAEPTIVRGPLVLVGGGEWHARASFEERLLNDAGGEVVVLPTAAAYSNPGRAIATARDRFEALGGSVLACEVYGRRDAEDERFAAMIAGARFIYLSGGSPLHLRSVLKNSAVFQALRSAWHAGATIAGSSAGAMVLSDPMVDPRGGALTVGFGLVRDLAIVPHYTGELTAQLRRTLELAPAGCAVVALPEYTACLRSSDGLWAVEGTGEPVVYVDGERRGLEELAGRPVD